MSDGHLPMVLAVNDEPLMLYLADEHSTVTTLVDDLERQIDLLLCGSHQDLPASTVRVEQAVRRLEQATYRRQAVASQVASRLGLAGTADLTDITDAWPDPDQQADLRSRCAAMRQAAVALGDRIAHSRALLAEAMAAVADALALLGTPPGYNASGTLSRTAGEPHLVDTQA